MPPGQRAHTNVANLQDDLGIQAVLAHREVRKWMALVEAAGHRVVVMRADPPRKDSSRGVAFDVLVYEDAGTHLNLYGTWRVQGTRLTPLAEDE